MTWPVGIALGTLACIFLWRYIYRYFSRLVKSTNAKDSQISAAKLHTSNVLITECRGSTTHDNPVNVNIPSQKQLSIDPRHGSLSIQSDTSVAIPSNSVLIHQLRRTFHQISLALVEGEHSIEIWNACKYLELCFQSGIGSRGKPKLVVKDKGESSKVRLMDVPDDSVEDTRTHGNRVPQDIDRIDTLEFPESHATPPDTKSDSQFRVDEQNLNTTIRRLVVAELLKCCKNGQAVMSRTRSDTNNRINWKRNKYNEQIENFNGKVPFLFGGESHDMSSDLTRTSRTPESVSLYPKTSVKLQDDSGVGWLSGEKNHIEPEQKFMTTDSGENDGDVHRDKGESELGDAVATEEPEAPEVVASVTVDTGLEINEEMERFKDAGTQTEHMYIIRAVRSCPSCMRRFQQFAASRGMTRGRVSFKDVPSELSFTGSLHRKASDNLIYEKGKASRSPSYVPVPERFRWRYVIPNKVN